MSDTPTPPRASRARDRLQAWLDEETINTEYDRLAARAARQLFFRIAEVRPKVTPSTPDGHPYWDWRAALQHPLFVSAVEAWFERRLRLSPRAGEHGQFRGGFFGLGDGGFLFSSMIGTGMKMPFVSIGRRKKMSEHFPNEGDLVAAEMGGPAYRTRENNPMVLPAHIRGDIDGEPKKAILLDDTFDRFGTVAKCVDLVQQQGFEVIAVMAILRIKPKDGERVLEHQRLLDEEVGVHWLVEATEEELRELMNAERQFNPFAVPNQPA